MRQIARKIGADAPHHGQLLQGLTLLVMLLSLFACEDQNAGQRPLKLKLSGCLGELDLVDGCRASLDSALSELPVAGCLLATNLSGESQRWPLQWRAGRPIPLAGEPLKAEPGETLNMSLFLFNPTAALESCAEVNPEATCTVDTWCALKLSQEGLVPANGGVFDFSPSGRGCNRSRGYEPIGEERCDGIDNDCDGVADEDEGRSCLIRNGLCEGTGRTRCDEESGDFVCEGEIARPSPERCGDLIDNDCDGTVDEGYETLGEPCETPNGCTGRLSCPEEAGEMLSCIPTDAADPSESRCDGVDDDCDGVSDENYAPQPLDGSCAACAETPYEICVDGAERESCREEAELETEERCDAIDEDCDGSLDETFTEQGVSCVIPGGIGRCANGQWRCDTGRLRCQGESPLAAETCNEIDDDCDGVVDEELAAIDDCDGIDNDCDGRVDEDFAPEAIDCRFGIACSLPGESRCVDGVFIEECPDDPRQPEICDGIDNNCDDSIDEGLVRISENQEGVCAGREDNCIEGEWISRTIPNYEAREQSCDRLDNDCDGRTDESISRLARNQSGVCEGIEERCSNGDWSTEYPDTYERVESRCDGLDNDCDGQADRNLSRFAANQQGVCVGRQELCQGGRWVLAIQPNYEVNEQSCDNRDNDCDGRVDENLTRPLAEAVGVCAGAIERCVAGVWRIEEEGAFEEVELSCDNQDNDCDGFIDENINRISQRPGVCRGLSERCVQGIWGYPPAPNFEAPESSCDDQDNDCDGEIDEGLNCAPPPVPCSLDPGRADCVATAAAGCRAGIYWLREEDDGNPGNANLIYGPAALDSFNPIVHRDRESPEEDDLIAPAFSCAAFDEEDADWRGWLEVNCHAALAWGNAANNAPAANCVWTPGIPGGTSNNICVASAHNAAPSWIRIDRELRRRPLGLAVVCDGIPEPARTLLEERLTPTLGRDWSRIEDDDGDCLPVDSPVITFARCGQARYECSTRNARGYAVFSSIHPEGSRRDCVRFSISSPTGP